MTNKYEAAIVLSVAQGEDATAALKEKFNDLIAKHGTIENVDDWGKRRLAYLINDEAEGYYVFFNFESEPSLWRCATRLALKRGATGRRRSSWWCSSRCGHQEVRRNENV